MVNNYGLDSFQVTRGRKEYSHVHKKGRLSGPIPLRSVEKQVQEARMRELDSSIRSQADAASSPSQATMDKGQQELP